MTITEKNPPVAVGGVGGSGTRLIGSILHELNFFMGKDINEANDNLSFTLLFKRRNLWPVENHADEISKSWQIFLKAMHPNPQWSTDEKGLIQKHCLIDSEPQYSAEWIEERAKRILNHESSSSRSAVSWGWKEPNTHILLPVLSKLSPGMKYIHVMRHGLDMAYSANQGQLNFWGELLLNEMELESSPENSFRYWCESHKRIIKHGSKLGANFLLLNYDNLCTNPEIEVPKLLDFLGRKNSENTAKVIAQISSPASIGRYKKQRPLRASQQDLDFLHSVGFEA